MPNHVTNKYEFSCDDKSEIEKIYNKCKKYVPPTQRTSWDTKNPLYKKKMLVKSQDPKIETVVGSLDPTTNEITIIWGPNDVSKFPFTSEWEPDMEEEFYTFDFEDIIPMPENIIRGNISIQETRPNWYDWCPKNWGTKWNAYDCDFNDEEKTIRFDTAWSPPEPITFKLSSMFPTVEIKHKFFDEGHMFWGEMVIKNSEILSSKEGKSEEDEYCRELCLELKGYDPTEDAEDEDD